MAVKPVSEMSFNVRLHPISALNINLGYDLSLIHISYFANLEDEYSLIKKVKPMFAKPNSRATVSYTHLDVYKRQVLSFAIQIQNSQKQ